MSNPNPIYVCDANGCRSTCYLAPHEAIDSVRELAKRDWACASVRGKTLHYCPHHKHLAAALTAADEKPGVPDA